MKTSLFQVIILCLAYLVWKIFAFSHPYPKVILNSIFLFLFFVIGFAYFISLRLGRVLLVFFGLSATRLASTAFNQEIDLVTNAPVFLGGIFGLIGRDIFQLKFPSFKLTNPHLKNLYIISILFLSILILDRFLVYYNFPFLQQVGMQELSYTPRFTSKMAFAFSSKIFVGLALPLLYFLTEEFTRNSKLKQDLILGVLFTLVVNAFVIGIQTYVNINFFSFQTNLAPTYGRATGFFRDAGSASLIFPAMLIFLFQYILSWKVWQKFLLSIIFFGFVVLLGKALGRAYWVLWILFIPYLVWYKFQILKPKLWFLGTALLVFLFFAYKTFLAKSPELISNFMSGNFAVIDPPRFFLNKVALYNFLQSPIFGNGLGSMPVFLDDPTHAIPNPERIIDNPMFFFGLLNDLGLLGFFTLGLFLFCLHLHFKNTLGIWILFSSLFAGYHVNHPDSAFWILLMLTYLNSKRQVSSLRWAKLINKVFIGILVLYLANTAVKAKNSEKVPLFRYDVLQKYQLQAFSVNQKSRVGNKEIEYHNFLGSVIWKVRHSSLLLKVHFFLSEFTKKEFLNLKISYLNQNYDMLSSQIVNIQKWQTRPVQLQISRDVEFIQVEELNEQGKVEKLGKHVYSVNQKNFNEKNEVTSIEGDFE